MRTIGQLVSCLLIGLIAEQGWCDDTCTLWGNCGTGSTNYSATSWLELILTPSGTNASVWNAYWAYSQPNQPNQAAGFMIATNLMNGVISGGANGAGYMGDSFTYGPKGPNGYMWRVNGAATNGVWYYLGGDPGNLSANQECIQVITRLPDMLPKVDNDGGASNVVQASATLNGDLVFTGNLVTAVSVYWGTADNGTNTVGWDHVVNFGQCDLGPLSTNVTGLTEGATYYYRFYGSNSFGTAWADPVAQFTTASTPAINNGGGASSIMPLSAQLNGNFTAGGNASVTVYWGTADGGTTPASWQHANSLGTLTQGAFLCNLNGLNPGTTYYYRCYALNVAGNAWAGSTASFQTAPTLANGWANGMKITFAGYNATQTLSSLGETLTNFPALVIFNTNLANFSYGQFVSTNGYDLRFLDSTETTNLNYEIDQWNVNGKSYVWVQVPAISRSNDCIWAYWGNPAAAGQPAACTTNGSTWNSNFDAVWHMKESNALDSTSNRLNGTKVGNVTASPTGIVDGADNFAGGAADYIGVGQLMRTQFTYSGWVYPVGAANNNIFAESIGSAMRDMYLNNGQLVLGWWNSGATTISGGSISTGSWYHVAGTWNGTTRRIYVNGICVGSDTPVAPPSGAWQWTGIGRLLPGGGWQGGLSYCFNGRMDELRVSNVGLSSNWIWASYMTVASNSLFSSYQVQSGSTPPATNATVHGIPYTWLESYGITNTNDSIETQCLAGSSLNVLQDYIAGMNPTNPNSRFCAGITNLAGQIIVRVPSVQATGANYNGKSRYYDVEMRTNLLIGSWQPVPGYTNIPASGSIITCTNATQDPAKFYRVKVWLQ